MALQLVLDSNGNYVYQDVRTSQQNITSKDFEAYEGDTKTTLATGGTNLGTQTDKLIRELPGTLTTDVDPVTGEVTTKGRTQQVAIEQKPMDVNKVDLRDELLSASKQLFTANISKHVLNIEVLLQKQVGVAEHPDIMETIQKEMEQIAHYKDLVDVVENYFE